MTIRLDRELERRISVAAASNGQATDEYIRNALIRQLANDERAVKREQLRAEFANAANDPLFMADVLDVERDFQHVDSETAGMLDNE